MHCHSHATMNSSPFPEEAFKQHPMARSEAFVSRINESEVGGGGGGDKERVQ